MYVYQILVKNSNEIPQSPLSESDEIVCYLLAFLLFISCIILSLVIYLHLHILLLYCLESPKNVNFTKLDTF